jgi:hypothetical protein
MSELDKNAESDVRFTNDEVQVLASLVAANVMYDPESVAQMVASDPGFASTARKAAESQPEGSLTRFVITTFLDVVAEQTQSTEEEVA